MKKVVITFSAVMLMLISGCATISDPKTYSEQVSFVPRLPVKKVLIIIDMSLEYEALPSGLVRSKEDNMKAMYEALGVAMVNAVNASGAEANYILYSSRKSLEISSKDNYSHIWLQKLNRATKTGEYISQRVWRGVISEWRENKLQFIPIYSSEYEADGPWCFMPPLIANKDECQTKYVAYVVEQFKKTLLTRQ